MSLNDPGVSVVIPTYNYAYFLRKCLASLVSQTFRNWEALVINNFSTDDTAEVVDGFFDKRIRLVNFRNNGVIAASRNKGIELASSGLIAFLDSDDIWYPGKLRACLNEFEAGADLACHGMRYMVNGKPWKDAGYIGRTKSDFFSLLYKAPHIFTSAVVVRRKYLYEAGGFDENPDVATAEDYDLWLKLSGNKLRFSFIREILGEYTCHSDSFSRQASFHLRASLKVINKYSSGGGFNPSYALKIRRAKALLFYGFGRNFQREGKRFMAMCFFIKSLATFPFLLVSYAGLFFNMLPGCLANPITHDLNPQDWIRNNKPK